MQYNNDPVDGMIDDIKGSTGVLAKVLFAGFNIVFMILVGIVLVTNLAVN